MPLDSNIKKIDTVLKFNNKMPKKQNYECIRCGYQTDSKSHMQKHLFLKKKPCPQTKNLIELTDDIKNHILDNRIYIIPTPVKPPKVTNIITNNNLIINMDTIDKLTKYTEYKQVEIVDFSDSVDMKMRDRADKFRYDDSIIPMNVKFISSIDFLTFKNNRKNSSVRHLLREQDQDHQYIY